jgi:hypothetical protein
MVVKVCKVKIDQAHAYDPLRIVISQVLKIAQVAGDDLQRLSTSIGSHLHPRTRYMTYHDIHLSSIVKDVIKKCSHLSMCCAEGLEVTTELSPFVTISISSMSKLRV